MRTGRPEEEKLFQRRHSQGESPTGRRTIRCLPCLSPEEEKHSRGGILTGESPVGCPTTRSLSCLPPREEKLFHVRHCAGESPTRHRTERCLPCLPPEDRGVTLMVESPMGRRTACCLPCLPPKEENQFEENFLDVSQIVRTHWEARRRITFSEEALSRVSRQWDVVLRAKNKNFSRGILRALHHEEEKLFQRRHFHGRYCSTC